MNLVAYGTTEPSTGNNPITLAVPRRAGSLVMDMAVSQYAFGKLEIMAQEGKMLDTPCGYDTEGNLTCDPREINRSKLMMPMALWKGSALSIMLDLMAASLSLGRTSLDIGRPGDGEKGMSQVFICLNPAAVVDAGEMDAQIERTVAFLSALPPKDGVHGVHVPGENLAATRQRNLREGIPVTEETWQKITDAAKG